MRNWIVYLRRLQGKDCDYDENENEIYERTDDKKVDMDENKNGVILSGRDKVWYKRLDEEIKWKKIGVYFNQNYTARALAHQYLQAPVYYYSLANPLRESLKENFKF